MQRHLLRPVGDEQPRADGARRRAERRRGQTPKVDGPRRDAQYGPAKRGGETDALLLDELAVARVESNADGADELTAHRAREHVRREVRLQGDPQRGGLMGTERDRSGGRLRAVRV